MTAEFPLAVHALVFLLHKGCVVTSEELADNICTNPARVRKVMAKLHRAGLAQASKGKGSGYRSEPNGGAVTLRAVLRALDEEPLSLNWRSGDLDKECLISSGMGAIMDDLYAGLNRTCEQKLETVTIGSINDRIFSTGGKNNEG